MAFIKETLSGVVCDNCKTHYSCEHTGYGYWMYESDAWESANNDGWTEENNKHYCNECYMYSDEDELIINSKRTEQ